MQPTHACPDSLKPTVTPAGVLQVHLPSSPMLSPRRLWSRVRSRLQLPPSQTDASATMTLQLSHHTLQLPGRTLALEAIQSITTGRRPVLHLTDDKVVLPTLSSKESAWLCRTLKLYRARRVAARHLIQALGGRSASG